MKKLSLTKTGNGHRDAANAPASIATREPDRERVARLAYSYWEERGFPSGSSEQDWYRAERELQGHGAGNGP